MMSHEQFASSLMGAKLADRYLVEQVLGAGGMGMVVAGHHLELEQLVAIKFMWPEFATDETLTTRFVREAKVAARIQSPHLVRVFDVGRLDSGVPYLVMERLRGRDIGTELEARGALPVRETVDWFLQALMGIAEIHAEGIVHRDLKPSNLFLAEQASGRMVKVLDFGISKDMKAQAEKLTATEHMLGTPHYMSPEQVRSSKEVDVRSDIWSLGVILYELTTGKLPFVGEKLDAVGEVFGLILFKDPIPPNVARPGLPLELQVAIMKCLQKDPAARYQSVAELAAALKPVVDAGSLHRIDAIRRTVPDVAIRKPEIEIESEPSIKVYSGAATAKTALADGGTARSVQDAPRTPRAEINRRSPAAAEEPPSGRWKVAAAIAGVAVIVFAAVFAIRMGTREPAEVKTDSVQSAGTGSAAAATAMVTPPPAPVAPDKVAPVEPHAFATASAMPPPKKPGVKADAPRKPTSAAPPPPGPPPNNDLILDRK